VRWYPTALSRGLATAALLALAAAVLTGHAALVLLAAPALGALALMPRRRPPELDIDVTLSGSRCFEGEEVTITATVGAAPPLDEITIELETVPQAALADASPRAQAFLRTGRASARWVIRCNRWGRYSPGTVRVTARSGALATSRQAGLDPWRCSPARPGCGHGWYPPSCCAGSASTPDGPSAQAWSSPASGPTCPATSCATSTGRSASGAASCTSTSGPPPGPRTWW